MTFTGMMSGLLPSVGVRVMTPTAGPGGRSAEFTLTVSLTGEPADAMAVPGWTVSHGLFTPDVAVTEKDTWPAAVIVRSWLPAPEMFTGFRDGVRRGSMP